MCRERIHIPGSDACLWRPFEHSGRMKGACLISRGYEQVYDTTLGSVKVRSKVESRQPAETVASDRGWG
jgi:hypothetical protein